MGRDFSIGCSDSTCKGTSHIMFQMVKLVSQIKDGASVDNIPSKDKHISIEQLATIIQSLKEDLNAINYDIRFKVKFIESYKFYEDDTFEKVFENCKRACDLFVDALVNSILSKEDRVYWDYS